MVNTNINPQKVIIDPRFDIPEGLDSFVYAELTDAEKAGVDVEISDVITVFTEATPDDVYVEDINHVAPAVPQTFTIIGQQVKTSPDGRQLVDVEIEVEDIPGVIQIDVRMTKT